MTIYLGIYDISSKSPRKMSIQDRLKEERMRLGLNQTEMAEAAGVGFSTYQTYERAGRFPNADTLASLHVAGVDVQYVVTGKRSTDRLSDEQQALLAEWSVLDERGRALVTAVMQTYRGYGAGGEH